MKDNSPGRIYLAGQRGLRESSWYRIFHTFNTEGYRQAHREPFGALYALNDETLAGHKSLHTDVAENSYLWLLPVVGMITYRNEQGNGAVLEAGEMMFAQLPAGSGFTITNPYEDELQLVNYMTILLKAGNNNGIKAPHLFSFDMNSHNQLEKWRINGLPGLAFAMGKFDGRKAATHTLRNPAKGAYAIVIQGAFEVNGRLLHERDGVALWDTAEVEFEALSNQAIIFLIEPGIS